MILSLNIVDLQVSVCTFDGERLLLYTSIKDNYRLDKTRELMNAVVPERILTNTFVGIGPLLTKENMDKIVKMPVMKAPRIFTRLTRQESMAIKAVHDYSKHKKLVAVENVKIQGYSDEHPIQQIQWNSFYVDGTFEYLNTRSDLIKKLLKSTQTVFGSRILSHWIFYPLLSCDEIERRRALLEQIFPLIPKITKLLKKCRMPRIENKMKLGKLRQALKAVILISETLCNIYEFKHKEKYVQMYKLLKMIDENNSTLQLTKEEDGNASEMQRGLIQHKIERLAARLSSEYQIPLSVVYFPQIGFVIEAEAGVGEMLFQIKDKVYSKNKDTKKLDEQFGDPYSERSMRQAKKEARILQKARRCNYTYLYNYVGEVDALLAVAQSSTGNYVQLSEENEALKIAGVEMPAKSIISGEYKGLHVLEMVLINQIGGKISSADTKLPVYRSVGYFAKTASVDILDSCFQSETRRAGVHLRQTNEQALHVIENPFLSTTPVEGFMIFSCFVEHLTARNVLISTEFEFTDCEQLARQIKAGLFVARGNRIEVAEQETKTAEQLSKLSKTSKYLLFRD